MIYVLEKPTQSAYSVVLKIQTRIYFMVFDVIDDWTIQIVKMNKDEREMFNRIMSAVSWRFAGKTKYKKRESFVIKFKYLPVTAFTRLMTLQDKWGQKVIIKNAGRLINSKLKEYEIMELFDKWGMPYSPHWWQIRMVAEMAKMRTGMGDLSMNAGKTYISYLWSNLALHELKYRKLLIIVPRVTLATQMQRDFKELALANLKKPHKLKVDVIYSGSIREPDARICIGNSASLANMTEHMPEFFDQFDGFVFDECDSMATDSILESQYAQIHDALDFNIVKSVHGYTGTIPTDKVKALEIEKRLGGVRCTVTAKQLIEAGQSAIPHYRQYVLNISRELSLEYLQDWRSHCMQQIEENDKWKPSSAGRFIHSRIYWDSHKKYQFMIARACLQADKNQLVFFANKKPIHLFKERLEMYIAKKGLEKRVVIMYGDTPPDERDRICKEMEENDNIICIANYQVMAVGVSIKNIETMHFASSAKAEKRFQQSWGRIIRKHPDIPHVFINDYAMKMCLEVNDYTPQETKGVSDTEMSKLKRGYTWYHALERRKLYTKLLELDMEISEYIFK